MLEQEKIKELSQFFGNKQKKVFTKLLKSPLIFELSASIDNEFFIASIPQNKTLMVASATAKEGKTTLSILLACLAALANPHKKILLIDSNFRKNGFNEAIKLKKDAPGLYEVLLDKATYDEATQTTMIPNLFVMTSKREKTVPKEMILEPFAYFMKKIKQEYDFTIIDSASTDKYSPSIGKIIENVLLVISYGEPQYEQIRVMVNGFNEAEANILGVVINKRKFVLPKILYG